MPASAENLRRLLNPRHVAFIGGDDAAFSAEQCARHFDGPVWGVNPTRKTLGGVPCFASVDDLPEAPDAVFLATPRRAVLPTLQALNNRGAGGVACYTAGYGELGEAGFTAEQALIEVSGDMALVGPNCYGLINYTNGATLWPFGAGDNRCQRGVALVMQSGMIPANLTMNQRSVPIAYVISAGNQAVLSIEDYIDLLVDDERVTAIGLYIEGIKDIDKFAAAALKALALGKPVVVLKAGRSRLAAQLSVSHTGSLAGSDQAFDALFAQLGMIRVDAPVAMLEVLKLLSVSGSPKGRRIAAFTCSGGDAALLADYCEKVGLELPQPSSSARKALTALLPDIATVSNPLDYTTPLWGNREVLPKVFSALMADGYDAAVVIQDFPPAHIHADNSHYRNDAQSFMDACNALQIPGAVCSDLPENIDAASRELIIAGGVTPLQGIDSGLDALVRACDYAIARQRILDGSTPAFSRIEVAAMPSVSRVIDEWQGKQRLKAYGIQLPEGKMVTAAEAVAAAVQLGFPLALKAVSAELPHKSEVGAVRLNLRDTAAVEAALSDIQDSVAARQSGLIVDQFLLETMVQDVIAELLIGIRYDVQFGQLLVIASGGVLVEIMQDAQMLLLPTSDASIEQALRRLKGFPLLQGFRGRPAADIAAIVTTIRALASFAEDNAASLLEMDINPLMVTPQGCFAADVMIRQSCDNQC